MEPEVTIQTYTVKPIMLPIAPVTPYMADPTVVDAVFVAETQQLNVSMTFMIPGDLDPSKISIKQYYSSLEANKISFYAVFNSSSTATPTALSCVFSASATDASGNAISLGGILSVFTMIMNNAGPKTSRGVMTSVRTTGV